AALLDEVVDHDLRAERVEVRAAAGERAAVVVDHADLDLLALRERGRGGHGGRGEDGGEQECREASRHGGKPSLWRGLRAPVLPLSRRGPNSSSGAPCSLSSSASSVTSCST